MVKITYVEPGGNKRTVDVEQGSSVMHGAIRNTIEGIPAECGGMCSCGTCRVYVDQDWQSKIGEPTEIEQPMINFIEDPNPNLRLSCQIDVTEELDGLVVQVADSQY